MRGARVIVVGSVNADLVVRVDRLPAPGETVTGGRFARHGGGKGANQAVAAARLGADVTLVGAVGDDDLGAEALAQLRDEGVDVSAVARLEGVATGVAAIVVDAAGENQVAVASGANAELTAEAVERALAALVGGADAVVLLGHEVPGAAVLAAARAAARAGWPVVLNPAPARPLPDELAALAPLLTPNAAEAGALAGEADPAAAARALAERTGAAVLVTLGARGALLVDGATEQPIAAPTLDALDTTGAGDALNGALAAELAAGRPLAEAAAFAVVAASLSTREAGARAGMPRRDEVRAALGGTAPGHTA
jgi:ribokinase